MFSCWLNHAEDRPDFHEEQIQRHGVYQIVSLHYCKISKLICLWNIYFVSIMFQPRCSSLDSITSEGLINAWLKEKMIQIIPTLVKSLTIASFCQEPTLSQVVAVPTPSFLIFPPFLCHLDPSISHSSFTAFTSNSVSHHLCDFRRFALNSVHCICNCLKRSVVIHATSQSYEDSAG